AITAAVILAGLAIIGGVFLLAKFGVFITAYFLLNVAYSLWLKHYPILDVMLIAAGFLLRVIGGVVLINVTTFSPWLYLVTTLGALFIGFGKRYAELKTLGGEQNQQRRSLAGYSLRFLDQMLSVTSATIIMAYALYTFSAANLPDNHVMMITIPFVLYGIFRYFYLIHNSELAGAPDELALKDLPLQITIALWALTILLIFYIN
ncbi:MAG TPA: decaprenyl-phosphate phosphoribosyltransferase, partial [Bellilinea sp.]|nr:decaprenyl-phosphate phosphoribosyltransferase [Bellilinea sp.]